MADSRSDDGGFPIIAKVVLCILATVFLLISYYIFLNKCNCCLFLRFSRRGDHRTVDSISPPFSLSSPIPNRGLDEMLIRNIPVLKYNNGENRGGGKECMECVVCLSEFRDEEMLRILPRCSHAFHLDCIDVWLQTNANCPLCRTCISGRKRFPADFIVAPTSSPHPTNSAATADEEEDFLVIEIRTTPTANPQPSRQRQRISMMGDEDFSSVQPIRRSFSMDSAADRQDYLWVQQMAATGSSGEAKRSFFSFGHGRRSSWVLPMEF